MAGQVRWGWGWAPGSANLTSIIPFPLGWSPAGPAWAFPQDDSLALTRRLEPLRGLGAQAPSQTDWVQVPALPPWAGDFPLTLPQFPLLYDGEMTAEMLRVNTRINVKMLTKQLWGCPGRNQMG